MIVKGASCLIIQHTIPPFFINNLIILLPPAPGGVYIVMYTIKIVSPEIKDRGTVVPVNPNTEDVAMSEAKACKSCGMNLPGDFSGDICPGCGLTYWKCGNCGFLVTAPVGPDTCPSCKEKCEFKNVTCYTPECGGPGNIDPRL